MRRAATILQECAMKQHLFPLLIFSMTACGSNDRAVTALATRLANEGGNGLSQDYRNGYIACGVKALSQIPPEEIDAALRAPDAPTIWKILGGDALDDYVRVCRDADLIQQRAGGGPEG